MRILVTGGAGFIGSEYVRMLLGGSDAAGGRRGGGAADPVAEVLAAGPAVSQVTVLDALAYSGNLANLAPVRDDPRLSFAHGDIRDAALLDDLLTGCDAVAHFAAESHVDRSITDPAVFVEVNVRGTQTLLEAARRNGVGRFLHVSTDEVYGSIAHGSWDESAPLAPRSVYSASKAGSDLLALAYHRTHGMDVVVTRCSNNYGHYQFPEKVIPLFVTNLLHGRPVPLYGDGLNVRDWVHVSDHCRGVHLALTRGRAGEVYHIGGGRELTNRELTGMLLEATGRSWDLVRPVADRLGHDRRYSLSWDKARHELGYQPQVAFEEGLARTVAWYREHEDWWRPLLPAARATSPALAA